MRFFFNPKERSGYPSLMQRDQEDGTDSCRKGKQEEIKVSTGHIKKKADDGDDEY